MDCKIKENISNCPCTYKGCSKKGKCCDCLKSHLIKRQLPACCFTKDAEKTNDRSFEHFIKLVNNGEI